MINFFKKTLTREIICLVFIGFLCSIAAFTFLIYASNAILDTYWITSDFIYRSEIPDIQEFQAYVTAHEISSDDSYHLYRWSEKNHFEQFAVSKNRKLQYDNSYADSISPQESTLQQLHYTWQYFHTVQFADGPADVFIYDGYCKIYYLVIDSVIIILCVILWFSIMAYGIHKKIKYIGELNQVVDSIKRGTKQQTVPVVGIDELGQLASGLENMRLALVEKEETERVLRKQQEDLVMTMAHDLRTPLTGLMTFLDIAQEQDSLTDCQAYIQKAHRKTTQIRTLSDQLFEYFLIHTKKPLLLEEPNDLEFSLSEYLSEFYGLLTANGYRILPAELDWKEFQVQICLDYMGRIIDNLVTNIQKYADPSSPIRIALHYSSHFLKITIKNTNATPNGYVHGIGIGVKNIATMMEQMNGSCSITVTEMEYTIALTFPITPITQASSFT